MKKLEIAKQLARRSRMSQGEAADRLDLMVQRIVAELRQGGEVSLPGLGKLPLGNAVPRHFFPGQQGGSVGFRVHLPEVFPGCADRLPGVSNHPI